ncbi:MAG TPA: hypothetical protein VGF56_09405 [Rhizomicrobium sp.]|jgi:hypothetical protein
MLGQILGFVFGIPGTAEERANALRNIVGDLSPTAAAERLRGGAQHNTEKAGALLAAQGIFTVADTFALDHGWPQTSILVSLGCLITGAFLAMSILRSTMRMYRHKAGLHDPVRMIFDMLISRMVRFNIALYLTFLSILLLALAAWQRH